MKPIEPTATLAWEGFRLSPQQERVWRNKQIACSQRTVCIAEVHGSLHQVELRAALADTVGRHEILRTRLRPILGDNGPALQLIDDPWVPDLFQLIWHSFESDAQEAYIERFLREEYRLSADDTSRLRVAVFTRESGTHTVCLSAPRYCLDGGSMRWLLDDLVSVYSASVHGQPGPRPPAVQYADFAQWQRDGVGPDTEADGAAYWMRSADWDAPPPQVPLERPGRTQEPVLRQWSVTPAHTSALVALARRHDVEIRVVVLACWYAVLWRVAGNSASTTVDVLFEGRPGDELRCALGCFESFGPVQVGMSPDMTLDDLIRLVGTSIDRATAQQVFLPLAIERKPARGSRYVGFSHYEWPTNIQVDGLVIGGFDVQCVGELFKVELVSQRAGDRLTFALRYRASALAPAGVDTLVDALVEIVAAARQAPERPLATLPLVTASAEHRLISKLNPARMPGETSACWHQVFCRQASATPNAIAIVCENRTLTYEALDRLSNRIARVLQRRGVRPGSIVGLLLHRSEMVIVALLAILKAGGAYLPLDPSLPRFRRNQMLAESGAELIVSETAMRDGLAGGPTVICLDAVSGEIEGEQPDPVDGGATAADLAYVLFTSGSSGCPKGVEIEHRHLMLYVDGAIDRLELAGMSSFATVSTLASDLGGTAIFPALCMGATLDVIPAETAADAEALANHFTRHPCDVLKVTPSHLSMLVSDARDPALLLPRCRLVLGGEPLGWGTFRLLQSFAPACRIFNHYGPTECCIGVLAGEPLAPATAELASTVPLGWPLKHARIYILAANGRPAPIGVPGELHIGGSTVARGYHNSADLTSERFSPDPFSDQPGARLYRTGDLARHLSDGSVEFIGRLDRQLKVRGFRVEPAEIEGVIRQHEDGSDALVVPVGESGDQKLVAYVRTDAGGAWSAERLRPFLRERLPDFMIPNWFVGLRRFPLMPNGKVDHSALPDPISITGSSHSVTVAPRTNIERAVAAIFAEILCVEIVYANDDFFDLGGHSLLATRLLSRLSATFHVDIGLRRIFEDATVSGLSAALDEQRRIQA